MTAHYLFKTKGMSAREIEIAMEVSKGLSNKEVANTFMLQEKTIKFHLTNIFKKAGVKSRTQLTVMALKTDHSE